MSFVARTTLPITELAIFRKECERLDLEYVPLQEGNRVAELIDKYQSSRSFARRNAYVVKQGKSFVLEIDNDTNYCSITNRLGKNAGQLMQAYNVSMLKSTLSRSGRMVRTAGTLQDGTMILKVAVGGI